MQAMSEEERSNPSLLIEEMKDVRAGGQPDRLKKLSEARAIFMSRVA